MCGIAGVFSFGNGGADDLESTVRAMTSKIVRRGPDDEGVWTDRKRCALGFRRLAILDLSPTGHQPMRSSDGRYSMVFNGEVYNFRELRTELEGRGHSFRSSGDAEVLLVSFQEWGTEAFAKFSGMFALAIYDSREERLVLARDHAGIKPLHFASTARGFVFGSQYDQLFESPWCRGVAPSADGLALYLRLGFVPAPFGLHEETHQIEAGHWLEIDAQARRRTGAFFDLSKHGTSRLRGEAAVDAFDEVFGRAIKRHLISDVPVGVFLSGGIDSPLVAAETRRQTTGSLTAYTIGVDDPRHDESADARVFATQLGLEQRVTRTDSGSALALLDDVVAASTEPTADFSMFPTLLVSKLAGRDVKVVLSGDGGDELYWGYPSRFGSAIEQAHYFKLPRVGRYAAVALRRFGKMGRATRDVLRFDSIGRLYRRKHTLMNEGDLAAIFPTLPAIPADFVEFDCEETDEDGVAQWVRWNEFKIHLARVLAKVDRASMYNSLEVRVPLLDKEVIAVAWATDWRTCLDLDARVGKSVLRRALARRVSHQTAIKKGFTVPMHTWLLGPLRPMVDTLLLAHDNLLGLPICRAALHEVVTHQRAGDESKAWGIWLLLSLALWQRRFGVR